jgi:hypothetical protein
MVTPEISNEEIFMIWNDMEVFTLHAQPTLLLSKIGGNTFPLKTRKKMDLDE